jgi:hypothetical protein
MMLLGSVQGMETGADKGISQNEVTSLVLSEVLKGETEGVWLFAAPGTVAPGTVIPTWYGDVALPASEGWLFFIDDAPMQSWAHPCRYVHVDMAGTITVESALAPPEDLQKWAKVAGSAPEIPQPEGVSNRRLFTIQGASNALPDCTNSDHCYAVLISGGANAWNNWPRYYGDIQFMYKTLVDYGYQDDHIYVLMSDGTDPGLDMHTQTDPKPNEDPVIPELYESSNPDLDGDGNNDVGYSATKANIATVFNTLQPILGTGDHLFIFTTDHGGPENTPQVGTNVVENLWNEDITDDAFAVELAKIPTTVPIMITMEQCFSGGFVDDVIPSVPLPSGQERVIATAANAYEFSYDDKGGTAVDADADNDGKVSLKEAFDYAKTNDHEAEHPQYSETPAGTGSTLALCSCYAPNLPIADAGPDQTIEQVSLAGTPVTLDGSGSSDSCGATLSYAWTWTGGSATGVNPTGSFPLGTTVVTLTVTADGRTSEPDTVSVTVQDTTPPVITVPAGVTLEQTTAAGRPYTLPKATATDICDADVGITNNAPAVFPLGETTVTFTATDDSGNSVSKSMKVSVVDTTPPVITVPADVTVEQASRAGTVVSLTATATDICDAHPVITSDALAIYPLGTTTVHFTATDASGNHASGTTRVTVVDTTPPIISVTVTPTTLWSPNHKMVDIKATVTATDICDAAPVKKLTSIVSDEPDDAIGNGDGNTVDDIQAAIGTTVFAFKLRAERAGEGDGRVYTIKYTATDASGNSASATATVTVPHGK